LLGTRRKRSPARIAAARASSSAGPRFPPSPQRRAPETDFLGRRLFTSTNSPSAPSTSMGARTSTTSWLTVARSANARNGRPRNFVTNSDTRRYLLKGTYLELLPTRHRPRCIRQLARDARSTTRGQRLKINVFVLHYGARAAVLGVKREGSSLGKWMCGLETRAARNVVIVATANKLARISWAVLASGNDYHPRHPAPVFSN